MESKKNTTNPKVQSRHDKFWECVKGRIVGQNTEDKLGPEIPINGYIWQPGACVPTTLHSGLLDGSSALTVVCTFFAHTGIIKSVAANGGDSYDCYMRMKSVFVKITDMSVDGELMTVESLTTAKSMGIVRIEIDRILKNLQTQFYAMAARMYPGQEDSPE